MRPQTLLLLVAIGLVVALQFLPLVSVEANTPDEQSELIVLQGRGLEEPLANGAELTVPPNLLAGFLIVGVVLPFVALWNFRKRRTQLRYINLSAVFLILSAVMVSLFVFLFQADLQNAGYTVKDIGFEFGPVALALAVIALIMAGRSTRRDIQKLRNADRFWD